IGNIGKAVLRRKIVRCTCQCFAIGDPAWRLIWFCSRSEGDRLLGGANANAPKHESHGVTLSPSCYPSRRPNAVGGEKVAFVCQGIGERNLSARPLRSKTPRSSLLPRRETGTQNPFG